MRHGGGGGGAAARGTDLLPLGWVRVQGASARTIPLAQRATEWALVSEGVGLRRKHMVGLWRARARVAGVCAAGVTGTRAAEWCIVRGYFPVPDTSGSADLH